MMAHLVTIRKIKQFGVLILLNLLLVLLCSCSTTSSIVGTWRLESGKFSYMSETYDKCAIEFTEMGEYILYEGKHYENDYYHGSYTYSDNQISMVIDDMFRSSANCSVDGDQLVLITSRGSATFAKVDTSAPAKPFGDYAIRSLYEGKGYQVSNVNLIESTEYTQTYQTTITASYKYMDEKILRQDTCVYSKIGQNWYLSSSEEVSSTEDWHINGLWTFGNTTLYIHSFTSTEAVVDHYHDMGVYPDYNYSGSISVQTFINGYGKETTMIYFPSNHGSIRIDKNEGILDTADFFDRPYVYQEE